MLLRDLKKVANECCFNPNKPSKRERVILDVGNPRYWVTRAMEYLRSSDDLVEGSVAYKECVKSAITLLLLTMAFLNDKDKKPTKTRKRSSGQDSSSPETT